MGIGLFLGALTLLALFLAPGLWTLLRKDDGYCLPDPQFTKIGELEIAVYRRGKGPQIVLLHGLGASSYCWRYLFPLLEMDHEVIALDLVGFGRSHKPTSTYLIEEQAGYVRDVLRQLDIRPVLVVGSSMGGLIALWLAKSEPQLIPKVIALSPAAIGPHIKLKLHVWTEALLPLGLSLWTMPWVIYLVVGTFKPLNRTSLKEYQRPFREPGGRKAAFHAGIALFDPRLPGLLAGINQPVLILRGTRDPLIGRATIENLLAHLPHAQFRKLKSSHHPQEHIPDQLAAEIRTWLKS